MTGFTSPAHIAVLLLVLLLVFGAKRLPELGRSIGHGLREFKDSVADEHPRAAQTIAGPAEAPQPDAASPAPQPVRESTTEA